MKIDREISRRIGARGRTALFMYMLMFTTFVDADSDLGSSSDGFELLTPDTNRVKLGAALERDETGMIVKGYLTRQPLAKGPIHGHIDIAVTTKTGELIVADFVQVRPNPIPHRISERARFTWRVPPQITSESRIELRFHSGSHTTK